MAKQINLSLAQGVGADGTATFSVSPSGLAAGSTILPAETPDGYAVLTDGTGYLTEPVSGSKTVYVRAEDADGYAIGKRISLSVPSGTRFLAPELTRSVSQFAVAVPLSYHRKVAAEAYDPAVHSVSDPLVPTCAIYTHKAVKSGNWSDPTVWDTGTIPHSLTDGTAVVCTNGFDIVYDMLSDVRIKDIHVNGASTFRFATTQTRLWVDTIMCDGKWIMGDVSAPIPDSGLIVSGKRVPQCEIVFWASEAPLATTRLGLNTMGPVRIHGAAKKHKLHTPASVLAGATSITFEEDVAGAGWKVGDEIMVVATEWQATASTDAQYTGPAAFYGPLLGGNDVRTRTLGYKQSQDEVRTIASIDGNTVHFIAPLAYNHFLYTDTLPHGDVVTLKPCVAMLTHSIRFRTADASDSAIWSGANLADRQKRAHTMFMFHDDVQARYAEAKNMGRTDVDPSMVVPGAGTQYADAGSTVPITDTNNVRGRYPWHCHRNGPYISRKQVVFENLTAWAPTAEVPQPGWAITHHDARAAVDNCVVYNARGAGIVSELGNEIGQWINNVVSWCRGDGFAYDWGSRAEQWTNHNGHQGVAYESQARQILQQGNIASSSHVGWMFMAQYSDLMNRIVDGESLRYRDPITQGPGMSGAENNPGAYDTYGHEQATVPDFVDNIAYACTRHFSKAHQQFTDRKDKTPFIIRGLHSVNCDIIYHIINYTFVYYVYDSLWIGKSQASSIGAQLGNVSWEMPFINVKLRRMNVGFQGAGHSIGYQTYWIDCEAGADVNTFGTSNTINFGSDPNLNNKKDLMGPWTDITSTSAKVRTYANISSASLPVNTPLAPWGPDSTFRTANPCPALGEDPYVVVDPSSVLTLNPNTQTPLSIRAFIVDSVGYRVYGDNQNPESNLSNMYAMTARTMSYATGIDVVKRNGCFNANGTWKTRLWHLDLDRFTGKHFVYYIDVTLSGFSTDFLNAWKVNPNATRPAVPIIPEKTANTVIANDTTAPTILTASAFNVPPDKTYSLLLDADDGQVRWSIVGGADAAQFELNNNRFLRWASNGTRSKTAPADANGDNVYEVTLRATDRAGNYSEKAMTFTVSYFRDDFDGAESEPLDQRYGWSLVSGMAGRTAIRNSHLRRGRVSTTGNQRLKADACTGPNQSVRFKVTAESNSRILLRHTDSNNCVEVAADLSGRTIVVWDVVGGTRTERAKYTKPTYASTTIRVDIIGTAITCYYNGVLQTRTSGTGTLSGSLPSSNDVGILISPYGDADELFDFIEFETLA